MATKTKLPAVLKSKTPKVYKNNKLNNGSFSNFDLNDYRVFLHIVSKLGKVDDEGKYLQPEKLEREHELTALEFASVFNVGQKHAYEIIKNATFKLMKADIFVREIGEKSTSITQINVCEKAKYIEGEGKINILFTGSIMPYLAQEVKQKFTLYNLKEIANFGSLHTTRLYELIQQFKDTGYIIRSVEQLRDLFAVGSKYTLYANFKLYTFGHACDEINDKTEYNIRFKELKEGRKVVAIEFVFERTIVEKRFRGDGTQKNTYIKPKHKEIALDA